MWEKLTLNDRELIPQVIKSFTLANKNDENGNGLTNVHNVQEDKVNHVRSREPGYDLKDPAHSHHDEQLGKELKSEIYDSEAII